MLIIFFHHRLLNVAFILVWFQFYYLISTSCVFGVVRCLIFASHFFVLLFIC